MPDVFCRLLTLLQIFSSSTQSLTSIHYVNTRSSNRSCRPQVDIVTKGRIIRLMIIVCADICKCVYVQVYVGKLMCAFICVCVSYIDRL